MFIPSGKDGVVRMTCGHGGGNLRSEVVELHGGDPGVETVDHLEGDLGGVDVVHVKTVAKLLNTTGDLVKVDRLLPTVPLDHCHLLAVNLGHVDELLYFTVTGTRRI